MARIINAGHVEAGDGAYATLYTCPASMTAIVGNLTAYNSTAGALDLTIAVVESDGTVTVVAVDSIDAGATASYSGGSTARVTPLNLASGNVLQVQGSDAGIFCRASVVVFA